MNNYNAMEIPVCEMVKDCETVNVLVENTNGILSEMNHTLCMIESALYGDRAEQVANCAEPKQELPLLEKLRAQRDFSEEMLKRVAHIREGLW